MATVLRKREAILRLDVDEEFRDAVTQYWISRSDVPTGETYALGDRGKYHLFSGWVDDSGERRTLGIIEGTYLDAIVDLLKREEFFGRGVSRWDIAHSHNGYVQKTR